MDPQRYSDSGAASELQSTLAQLRDAMVELAGRYLGEGDQLKIEVVDVDLAGQLEMTRSGTRDVRILSDASPPRIRVRYSLVKNGVAESGEELIAYLSYRNDPRACMSEGPLCHETRMLERWFARKWGKNTGSVPAS